MQVERDGITYEVKRRWVPWRWRKRDPDDLDLPGPDGFDDVVVAIVVLLVVLVLLVLAPFVLVWLIAGLELLMLVLLLPLFVVLRWTRVLRWPIDVWADDVLVHEEVVRGWGASRERMREIADEVRLGRHPASRPDPVGEAD